MRLVVNTEKMAKVMDEVLGGLVIVLAVVGKECKMPLRGAFWVAVVTLYIMYILYSFVRMVFETWVCKRKNPRKKGITAAGVVRLVSVVVQIAITAVLLAGIKPLIEGFRTSTVQGRDPPLFLALTVSVLYLPQVARRITSRGGSRSVIYRIILPVVAIAAMGTCVVFDILSPLPEGAGDDDPRYYRFTKFAAVLGTFLISIGSFVERDIPMPKKSRKVASAAIGMALVAMSLLLSWRIKGMFAAVVIDALWPGSGRWAQAN